MNVRNYALVTAAYWAFTITDGALRMLVLLHFHNLGYNALTLAFLFLLYEFFGIVTNLYGGWLGARFGLNRTLIAGLAIQIVALMGLSFVGPDWVAWLSVAWVMLAQALSGIAKDLTKLSSKSAIKLIVGGKDSTEHNSALFKWVALLTGSKNALKGLGFFVGGVLLQWMGFREGLWLMAAALGLVLIASAIMLGNSLGTASSKAKLRSIFSKSTAINRLSAARIFLFGARDVWFVVGLPLYLYTVLEWSFEGVGGFMAAWVIGYGFVQAAAPKLLSNMRSEISAARIWSFLLAMVTIGIATAVSMNVAPETAIIVGLIVFGMVFAVNSSLHSFLILAYTKRSDVAMDVGFYYSANAAGRLIGTLVSGLSYLLGGVEACMWVSAGFLIVNWLLSLGFTPLADDRSDSKTASV